MIQTEEHQSGEWFTMSQAAKMIGSAGRNTLYKILREQEILMHNNEPYQRYCDTGFFKLHMTPKYTKKGLFITYFPSVLVSEPGLQFIQEVLKKAASPEQD